MDEYDTESIFYLMTSPLLKAIDFKYFDLSLRLGIKDNPFAGVIAMQVLRSAYHSLVSYIRSKQKLGTKEDFTVDYGDNELKIQFFGILSLTLVNAIISLFKAVWRRLRLRKRKEVVI
ncbi:MAG: hypothetical protein IJX05_01770 [Clostridia bacterium]|nr:hypothetical protein [Clostridia bacterium]